MDGVLRRVAAARRGAPADGADPEDGFTLVEVLIAVMIMGLVFTVVLTGIFAAIVTTQRNRRLAESDRLARGLAEQVKEGDVGSTYEYRPCGTPNGTGAVARQYPAYTPPQPHQTWRVTITRVQYRVPSNPTAWSDTCSTTGSGPTLDDGGAQRITITARPPVSMGDEPHQTVVVVKRDTRGDGS